jgi:uncharacterized protein
MQEFITYILNQIVTNPEAIVVTEEMEGDAYVYHIKAAQEDMGLIIGKEGRNINSVRNLAKAKAIKENIFVRVILEETGEREEAPAAAPTEEVAPVEEVVEETVVEEAPVEEEEAPVEEEAAEEATPEEEVEA